METIICALKPDKNGKIGSFIKDAATNEQITKTYSDTLELMLSDEYKELKKKGVII